MMGGGQIDFVRFGTGERSVVCWLLVGISIVKEIVERRDTEIESDIDSVGKYRVIFFFF